MSGEAIFLSWYHIAHALNLPIRDITRTGQTLVYDYYSRVIRLCDNVIFVVFLLRISSDRDVKYLYIRLLYIRFIIYFILLYIIVTIYIYIYIVLHRFSTFIAVSWTRDHPKLYVKNIIIYLYNSIIII